MEIVKKYKIQLDNRTINTDKNVSINLGGGSQGFDQRDLIALRSETIMDKIFAEENPTIDFEKSCFNPESTLTGIDFYFYRRLTGTKTPISYDDSVHPVWAVNTPGYDSSSEFSPSEIPDSNLFLNSFFKFDFTLGLVSQINLFSVVLPLDGTMLIAGQLPRPKIDFHQTIKTELENIYWLRKPEQLPGTIMNGTSLDLYCTVSFVNYKNGKTTRFKTTTGLPNDALTQTEFTSQDYYIKYTLEYNTLKYKISDVSGNITNRLKLYAV